MMKRFILLAISLLAYAGNIDQRASDVEQANPHVDANHFSSMTVRSSSGDVQTVAIAL